MQSFCKSLGPAQQIAVGRGAGCGLLEPADNHCRGVSMSLRALILTQGADRKVSGALETLTRDRLPVGDVTVAVDYSTLNYKDGLVLTTGGGLVKSWPHVGGIDFAGTVETSDHAHFKAGDKVVLNGWRVGELHWGGYAPQGRVQGDWPGRLPAPRSAGPALADGHPGFTPQRCAV